MQKKEQKKRIQEIETLMGQPDFWNDKNEAQKIVQEYNTLKEKGSAQENFPAVVTIIAGTGGDDAEDFARILATMYRRYAEDKNFTVYETEKHETPKNGYKNITLEIADKKAYTC